MSPTLSDYRRLSVLREHRQINFFRAAIVGLLAGLLVLMFQRSIIWGQSLREELISELVGSDLPGWLVLALFSGILGGLAAWITVRVAPEATGSGIPHIKATVLHLRPLNWRKTIPVKFFCGALALTAGFSLGREGPSVQLGGSIGAFLAEKLRVPRKSHAHLIACGSGAGLAAVFNAPLAGFIFVIEELRRELSPLTYGTALIAAVVADLVGRVSHGASPAFALPEFAPPPLSIIPFAVLIGILTGACGTLFNAVLLRTLAEVPRLRSRVPRWLRAFAIGAIVGTVGWFLPETLGPGDSIVGQYVTSSVQFTAATLLLIFTAKLALTVLCYCSGVPGGIFGPVLAQGALLGLLGCSLFSYLFPSLLSQSAPFGVIGMAGYFAAVVRAPLTGVILIVELTGNYNLLFVLLVTALSAYLMTELLGSKPVYESLLQLNLRLRGPKESAATEPVLVDVVVEPHSAMDGSYVRDLDLPEGCLLVTVRKGAKESVPKGSTVLRAGDEITVVIDGARASGASLIRAFATAP